MQVLILVQSIERDRYPELIQVQKDTWGSVYNPDIKTIFYYPDKEKEGLFGQDLYIKSNPHYYLMFHHAIAAIKFSLQFKWDYLFKCDNSSYVNKQELIKTLENKPRTLYYGGQKYIGNDKHITWPFLWGEGVVLSRDVCEYLVKMFDELIPPLWYGAEDIYFGRALEGKFSWDESLLIYQYWKVKELVTKSHHVYRCKNDNPGYQRFDDEIKAMRHIHHVLNILNNQ